MGETQTEGKNTEEELPFIIERTNRDRTFTVVGRFKTFEEALEKLRKIKSSLRHEIWHLDWPNTEGGYKPMAWIN